MPPSQEAGEGHGLRSSGGRKIYSLGSQLLLPMGQRPRLYGLSLLFGGAGNAWEGCGFRGLHSTALDSTGSKYECFQTRSRIEVHRLNAEIAGVEPPRWGGLDSSLPTGNVWCSAGCHGGAWKAHLTASTFRGRQPSPDSPPRRRRPAPGRMSAPVRASAVRGEERFAWSVGPQGIEP